MHTSRLLKGVLFFTWITSVLRSMGLHLEGLAHTWATFKWVASLFNKYIKKNKNQGIGAKSIFFPEIFRAKLFAISGGYTLNIKRGNVAIPILLYMGGGGYIQKGNVEVFDFCLMGGRGCLSPTFYHLHSIQHLFVVGIPINMTRWLRFLDVITYMITWVFLVRVEWITAYPFVFIKHVV